MNSRGWVTGVALLSAMLIGWPSLLGRAWRRVVLRDNSRFSGRFLHGDPRYFESAETSLGTDTGREGRRSGRDEVDGTEFPRFWGPVFLDRYRTVVSRRM